MEELASLILRLLITIDRLHWHVGAGAWQCLLFTSSDNCLEIIQVFLTVGRTAQIMFILSRFELLYGRFKTIYHLLVAKSILCKLFVSLYMLDYILMADLINIKVESFCDLSLSLNLICRWLRELIRDEPFTTPWIGQIRLCWRWCLHSESLLLSFFLSS